ncbi:MAG: hypothetical protein HYX68_23800 [Planctomycetes bacterium]|nr:hypothetical protein [Planctomycetota bacterium]
MLSRPGAVVILALLHVSPLVAQPLKLVWEFPTPGEYPMCMVADRVGQPYLYVAVKNGGLRILDISKTNGATDVAKIGTDQFGKLHVMHLTQRGTNLYLALGEFFNAFGAPAGLAVVDVKNPRQPRVTALWKSAETLTGSAAIVVDERFAYLGAMKQGVMIFDVSRPGTIRHVSTYQPDIHFPRKNPTKVQHPNARGLFLIGKTLYVAYDAGGLRILDVSDRGKPREIGRYANAAMAKKQQAYNDVHVEKGLAYLPCDYAGLEIVDVRNPRAIRQVAWWNPWQAHTFKNLWFNSPGHTNQIAYDAKRKRAYLSAGDSELQVIDISNPVKPRLAESYGQPKNKHGVWGVAISSNRVYLAYITAVIPFRGTWAGVKALKR